MHALAVALYYAAVLAHFERNPAEVERLASDLIELSTRHNFALLAGYRSRFSAVGRAALQVTQLKVSRGSRNGIERLSGNRLGCWPCHYFLALKAEALHLADRTSEALEAIREAEALAERFEAALLVCRTAPAPRGVSRGYGC